ncbi:MAG: hypothetical protein AAF846_17025 [Chloroflexota bacterium]
MAQIAKYRDYKPSGKAPFSGVLSAFIITTIVSIILGLVAAGVAQFVYLVFVFPIAMIGLGAVTVENSAKAGKIRNRLVFVLLGLWSGALIYSTYWTGEYLFIVEDFYQTYQEEGFTRLDALAEVGASLEDDTGYPHVLGYILWSIEGGLELSSTRPGSSSGFSLDEQQTAIYWGVEALAVVILTAVFAFIAGKAPFSEDCGKWYDKAEPEFIGYVDNKDGKQFIKYMRASQIAEASNLVNLEQGNTHLFAFYFDQCNSNEIMLRTIRYQGRNKVAIDGIMTKSAYNEFLSLL